ncbi:MAG TPA: HD domain-containing phosphohydrolase [Acidobacteriota bacterium]|nr:HD domain-containing phosphohydrolase [Acidobacteriota bacterium]
MAPLDKSFMKTILGASVEVGPIPFNLYSIEHQGEVVLLCKAGYEITPEQKEMLGQHDRVFYVRSDEQHLYLDYATDRIDHVIENPQVLSRDKAALVTSVGRRVVQRVIESPRSGPETKRAGEFVESYIDLVLRFPEVKNDLFAIASYGKYLLTRSFNVCTFCLLIGEVVYGHNRRHLWQLGMGGLLHDVGMTRIDKNILNKPGMLTNDECKEVKNHPIYSFEILEGHDLPHSVLMMARGHHERIDGSGYPDGLSGTDIHPFALLAGIADTYDAMTSDAPYKPMAGHLKALKELSAMLDQFDKDIFLSLLKVVLVDDMLVDRFLSGELNILTERNGRSV